MLTMRAIVIALISLGVALNVYAQSPKQKQPLPQPNDAQHDSKPDERGTGGTPLIIKVLPSPDEAEKTAADKQEREDKSKSDWWLVGLTGVLAVIGAVQIIVFSIQAFRLRQSVDEMKIATKATEKAASAALKSAEVAELALVITQRASLHAKEYTAEPTRRNGSTVLEWRVRIVFENSGNTRADNVHAGAVLYEVVLDNALGSIAFIDKGASASLVVGPNNTVTASGIDDNNLLTLEQVQKITSGAAKVFLCGRVDYRDIFPSSPPRHTSVCMRLSVEDETLKRPNPFGFWAHTHHNEAT